MAKKILAWHFIPRDMKTRYSDQHVEAGTVLRVKGPLVMCENGLHFSRRILDALSYARQCASSDPCPILCRVEVRGQILEHRDKGCSTVREAIWTLDPEWYLHEFSCRAAEKAIEWSGVDPDPRSLAAIQAKRDWLAGDIDDQELAAAWFASAHATQSAAHAAHQAARAARAAGGAGAARGARDAAWLARGAARAAGGAAWAAWAELNTMLEAIIDGARWEKKSSKRKGKVNDIHEN